MPRKIQPDQLAQPDSQSRSRTQSVSRAGMGGASVRGAWLPEEQSLGLPPSPQPQSTATAEELQGLPSCLVCSAADGKRMPSGHVRARADSYDGEPAEAASGSGVIRAAEVLSWVPILTGILFLWPVENPLVRNAVNETVVLFWKHKWLPLLVSAPPFMLYIFACRRGKISCVATIGHILGIFFLFLGYLNVLISHLALEGVTWGYQNQLQHCLIDCGSPWRACVVPKAQLHDMTIDRHAAAVAEFRDRAVGDLLTPVNVSMDERFNAVIAVGPHAQPVRFVDNGPGAEQRGALLKFPKGGSQLATSFRYVFHVPRNWPDGKGFLNGAAVGGQIAIDATVIEQLALLVRARLGVEVSIFGCSTKARSILWAAATAAEPSLYKTVFLEGAGTFGFASVRHVGQCGEPMNYFVRRCAPPLPSQHTGPTRPKKARPATTGVGAFKMRVSSLNALLACATRMRCLHALLACPARMPCSHALLAGFHSGGAPTLRWRTPSCRGGTTLPTSSAIAARL